MKAHGMRLWSVDSTDPDHVEDTVNEFLGREDGEADKLIHRMRMHVCPLQPLNGVRDRVLYIAEIWWSWADGGAADETH